MGSLDKKATEFTSLGNRAPVPQYWTGSSEINGIRYNVVLRPLFGYEETRAKVSVTLDFHQRDKPRQVLTEPIKPPAGYEHESMEPPVKIPNKPFPNPKYTLDNMLEAAKAAEDLASASENASSATPIGGTPQPSSASQAALPRPWRWIISACLLVAVVGGALFWIFRKSG